MHVREGSFVILQNTIDPLDFRLIEVSVQGEAMRSLSFSHELWHTSETKNGEVLKMVIGFENVTHLGNSLLVLVVMCQVVERELILNLAIRSSEVNRY